MSVQPTHYRPQPVEEPFLEKHFAKVAFAVSVLALFLFAPLDLIFGMALGFAAHYYSEPNLKIEKGEPILTVSNAVFSIVGGVAALLRMTPAGSAGGLIFRLVPFASALALGSTVYRGFRSI